MHKAQLRRLERLSLRRALPALWNSASTACLDMCNTLQHTATHCNTLQFLSRHVPDRQCQHYGVATISRLLKIIGLFCRILSLLQVSFAKETYNFEEPTNRCHPIPVSNKCLTKLRESLESPELPVCSHTPVCW